MGLRIRWIRVIKKWNSQSSKAVVLHHRIVRLKVPVVLLQIHNLSHNQTRPLKKRENCEINDFSYQFKLTSPI
jgi:hypothetical protein